MCNRLQYIYKQKGGDVHETDRNNDCSFSCGKNLTPAKNKHTLL